MRKVITGICHPGLLFLLAGLLSACGAPSRHPPTTVITTEDYQGNNRKTLWYNCRNYRANLLWEGPSLKIRDLHVFDERLRSEYLDRPDTLPAFRYETLPLVDGCLWSTAEKMAGLHLVAPNFQGAAPVFSSEADKQLVTWPSANGKGRFILSFTENDFEVAAQGGVEDWYLELSVAPEAKLPFTRIDDKSVRGHYLGMDYGLTLGKGTVTDLRSDTSDTVFRIDPQNNRIDVNVP